MKKFISLGTFFVILISGLVHAHEENGDIFESPIFTIVFGAMGLGLYGQFLSKKEAIPHPIELGAAFFGGYFFIKLAFNFLISALA